MSILTQTTLVGVWTRPANFMGRHENESKVHRNLAKQLLNASRRGGVEALKFGSISVGNHEFVDWYDYYPAQRIHFECPLLCLPQPRNVRWVGACKVSRDGVLLDSRKTNWELNGGEAVRKRATGKGFEGWCRTDIEVEIEIGGFLRSSKQRCRIEALQQAKILEYLEALMGASVLPPKQSHWAGKIATVLRAARSNLSYYRV
ncbi:hypothetical protein B0H10DRAFT_1955353 [Mycena sp. CBHHK59/15]|nr:hypothetical protein B0H10DRAFT_1955353 [Mycena sp. CBHHK59/15]